MNIISDNNYLENNNGANGGVYYISSVKQVQLRDDHYYMNNGAAGRILNSIAADLIFNISDCTIEWENHTEEEQLEYLEEENQNSSSTFYITGVGSQITSRKNLFKNNLLTDMGAIFSLSYTTFSDYGSEFLHNGGILGGAIQASHSWLDLEQTLFMNNYGVYGGAFYIESESSLVLRDTNFIGNSAYTQGGCIFITTRSSFEIYSSTFTSNRGNSDSVLTSFLTSDTSLFVLDDCLFEGNSAFNNTLSFYQSDGSVSNCKFYNNVASFYSGNIFSSFSALDLQHIDFYDELDGDPLDLLKSSEIQGQFLFISLGVQMSMRNCSFTHGLSAQGGAIFLNGLSSLQIYSSSF